MNRLIPGLLAVVVALFALAALLTGDADWIVPALVLLAIVAVFFVAQLAMRRGTHVEGRDAAPLGATSQAHDELTPQDLPLDHPGRAEAERQARFDREGVTRGNVER